jgi:hypothetical protein
MSQQHNDEETRLRIDVLVTELLQENVKIIKAFLDAAEAGERPNISLKNLLDVIARFQMTAREQRP